MGKSVRMAPAPSSNKRCGVFVNQLVYPRERMLGTIALVLGLLIWLALIVGTLGGALLGLALGFVLYLFAQSAHRGLPGPNPPNFGFLDVLP